MTAEPPADRPEASGHTTQSSVRADYAYPSDLAKLVLLRWDAATAAGQIRLPAPATSTLAQLLSICYQATLLREEGRPVTFRLAISAPETFDPAAGPPSGVRHRIAGRASNVVFLQDGSVDHMTRIVGLALSIRDGDINPNEVEEEMPEADLV